MLDQDILTQVEAEGWLTPVGRLFKAGCRMIDRVHEERQNRDDEDEPPAAKRLRLEDHEDSEMQTELASLREQNQELRDHIKEVKETLKHVG